MSGCPHADVRTIKDGEMKQTTTRAPCSICVTQTTHVALYEKAVHKDQRTTTYTMLECRGCGKVCLGEHVRFDWVGEEEMNYYPEPVSRKEPTWLLSLIVEENTKDRHPGVLLHEIYQAVHGGQYRLAAMGVRALLEQVMVSKVGDLGSFEKHLDAFQEAGYISFVQRETMVATIEVGHATTHRGHLPNAEDLQVALDIVEGIMAPIYHHQGAAEKMVDRVPPRPPRKS